MDARTELFVYSKDRDFIRSIKDILRESFRIKKITKESDLPSLSIRQGNVFLLDISANNQKIPEWFYGIPAFRIITYDKFTPENINEILPFCHFYISKSAPASDFAEKMKRIRTLISMGLNRITFLPGNTDFENEYTKLSEEERAVAFIDIDNFRYFYSAKGILKSEMLLRLLSTIIRKNILILPVRSTAMAYNIFMDRFAIVADKDELMRICSFIYEDFSRYKNILFDNSELTRQFFVMQDRTGNIYDIPVTTITTVLITRYFKNIIELYKTAEDLFRYLKSKGGNLIFSDRRQIFSASPEKGTILIAVYDPMKSNYLKIALERLGWKIFCTNDGITALKLYNRVKPSIIILDEEIPLINYRDIINVLRYELSDNRTAIVLLSEIDEWINSQYRFTTLSKDINAEKINQKFVTLLSQSFDTKG
ncbi:MAG: hypothetical protein N3B13_08690 [Deltaproteobacteria bacterium]|nr:hypothetical protein [Deltaproteobacteria bacterium]